MIKGIIFDLDGTLADTIEDLTRSMNCGLDQVNCPRRTVEECRQMVGSGLKNFVSQALPDDRQDLQNELLDAMVQHYQTNCLDKTTAYDGMPEVLASLYEKGVLLAVLTNKNQVPAETIIHYIFGKDVFPIIVGASETRKVKPDPASTLQIVSEWQLQKSEVLYVGDSDIDILTARAAGLKCVACLWGYRSRQQLTDAGAEVFIEHPRQLLDCLEL